MFDLQKNANTVKVALWAAIALAAIVRILYLIEVHDDVLLRMVTRDDVFDQYRFMQPVAQIMNGNWLGPKTAYSLGYSYVISLLYLFFPKDITTVFIFQIILGVTAVYVSYRAAALLFNEKKAGLIAAFMVALYAPFVFQECDIERGAIIAYSNLFCFYFLIRALRKDKIKYFFLAGLMMGFSIAIRPNILPVFVIPYIFFKIKRSYQAKIGSVMTLVLGILILALPFAFRNMAMGQGFNIEPQGIQVFWVGNAHDSLGINFVHLDSSAKLAHESGNNMAQTAAILWREIKKYPEAYWQLYVRKIKMFLNGYEVPANLNYYLFKELYPVLNICFLNFSVISPLALAGIFLARKKYRFIGLFYIFLFVLSFSNIAFHIQGRYRIPAVPFFIIMASYTVYWLIEKAAKKEWVGALYAALAIGCLAFYTRADHSLIKKYSGEVIRSTDYANCAIAYLKKSDESAIDHERKDDLIKAGIGYLKKAIKLDPLEASYYVSLGDIYSRQGNLTQAIFYYDKAIEINPNSEGEYNNRGNIYDKQGQFIKAMADFNKAIALKPDSGQSYNNRAVIFYQLKRYDEAMADLSQAQARGFGVNPQFFNALKQLSREASH